MIERNRYLEIPEGLRDKNLIKVLTGVKPCDKSRKTDFGHNFTHN